LPTNAIFLNLFSKTFSNPTKVIPKAIHPLCYQEKY